MFDEKIFTRKLKLKGVYLSKIPFNLSLRK